ncbi:MAG: hypothetical protein R3Y28_05755 [Candidatus Gastranaerophilales bacterium]
MIKTKLLIEQHFHGAFGIDFNRAGVDDVLHLSKEIFKYGIGGIFPTIVTDSVENIRSAIAVIKEASEKQSLMSDNAGMARILGIHLEGVFLNPEKKGIHNPALFLLPCVENYKLIEDDFIKIVTLAPELDNDFELSNYLLSKGIKVQAGHCVGSDLSRTTGVTHLFNAMSGVSHRDNSTALSALIDENIFVEIIADGVHVGDEIFKLVLNSKALDKVILVADCLPITKSGLEEVVFAGEKIYYDGKKATSENGTLAGSTKLLSDIIQRLASVGLFDVKMIDTPYIYHGVDLAGSVEWDEDWNILKVNPE